MQLAYRGRSYTTSPAPIETSETEQVGHYLGKTFAIRHSRVVNPHPSATTLRYRGAEYLA